MAGRLSDQRLVRVAAVPDIGGRLMAYDLADYSYLFVDPELAGKLFTVAETRAAVNWRTGRTMAAPKPGLRPRDGMAPINGPAPRTPSWTPAAIVWLN